MNNKQKENIIEQLEIWFEESSSNKNRFYGDILGEYLRKEFTKLDHWKGKSRGDSEKGYFKYLKDKNESNKKVVGAPNTLNNVTDAPNTLNQNEIIKQVLEKHSEASVEKERSIDEIINHPKNITEYKEAKRKKIMEKSNKPLNNGDW